MDNETHRVNHSALSSEWHEWLLHNIGRGCTDEDLLNTLINANMDLQHAQHAVLQAKNLIQNRLNPGRTACSQPFLKTNLIDTNVVELGDVEANLLLRMQRPDIAYYENVLLAEECDELIEMSRTKMDRSRVIDSTTGDPIIIESRTSSTCGANFNQNPLVTRIENRLAKLVNWPVKNSEKLQVINYQADCKFGEHYDYFSEYHLGKANRIKQGGQRTATLLVYLNDVSDGGGTHFPYVGLTILPRKGCMLYFAYSDPNGELDTLSLHEGLPVKAGEKWVAVLSLRQNPNQFRSSIEES